MHPPTPMVYAFKSGQRHQHNTRHGTRDRMHWFKVYKCPVCGVTAAKRRQPIICRGKKVTHTTETE
jgi:hypothetical protein